ncbi:MAG: nuclear transport factor 2 family protein [Rhodospirillaceae bacterium]
MKLLKTLLAPLAMALALYGTAYGTALAGGDETTKAVIEHHLAAFGAADMAEIMADYSDTSVIVTQGGELRGKQAMQGLFTTLIGEFAKPGAKFNLQKFVVEDDIGYIVWDAETADNIYELGTDTFLIRNGKIEIQTLAAKVIPKN